MCHGLPCGWSSIHQYGFMQLYTNNKDSFYRMDDHKPNTIHMQSFDHGACIPVQQARSAGWCFDDHWQTMAESEPCCCWHSWRCTGVRGMGRCGSLSWRLMAFRHPLAGGSLWYWWAPATYWIHVGAGCGAQQLVVLGTSKKIQKRRAKFSSAVLQFSTVRGFEFHWWLPGWAVVSRSTCDLLPLANFRARVLPCYTRCAERPRL